MNIYDIIAIVGLIEIIWERFFDKLLLYLIEFVRESVLAKFYFCI